MKKQKTMKPTMPRVASKGAPDLSVVPETILEVPTKVRKGKVKPVGSKKVKPKPNRGVSTGKSKKGSGGELNTI